MRHPSRHAQERTPTMTDDTRSELFADLADAQDTAELMLIEQKFYLLDQYGTP